MRPIRLRPRHLAGGLVVLVVMLVLAFAWEVEAQLCPATLDPQTYPYGGCICSAPGIPMGGVACPVAAQGMTLSCGCQSAGSVIQCYDAAAARCGGILPYCASKDICNGNSATVCLKGGLPTYAPDCYVAGLVTYASGCTCYTTTVRLPQSVEQTQAYCKLRDLIGAVTALLTFTPVPGPLYGANILFSLLNAGLGSQGVYYAALCQGSASRTDFTEYAPLLPYPATPYSFSTSDGFYANQADDANLLIASVYRLKRQLNVLEKALERSKGAAAAAAPYHQEDQLDLYNEAADALHLELLNLIVVAQRFNTPRWAARPNTPDMRYLFEPLWRQSTLDGLSEIAAVNLRAN